MLIGITGGNGFVAQHFCKYLQRLNISYHVFTENIVEDDIDLSKVTHLVHLAGKTDVLESWSRPEEYFFHNTFGTCRVLEACRRYQRPIIFLSTALNRHEEQSQRQLNKIDFPNNPYGFSKIMSEEIIHFYHKMWEVRGIILRVFNLYGPGQSTRFLIPSILNQCLDTSIKEIIVKDLKPKRDYIYIDDLIDVMLRCINLSPQDVRVYEIGTGQMHSVEEVIQVCQSLCNTNKTYKATNEKRPHEIDYSVANTASLMNSIGWKPHIFLKEGISNMIKLYQN